MYRFSRTLRALSVLGDGGGDLGGHAVQLEHLLERVPHLVGAQRGRGHGRRATACGVASQARRRAAMGRARDRQP